MDPGSPQAPELTTHYEIAPRAREQIEAAFVYHPPKGDQPKRYDTIRTRARDLALLITELVPPGREQSLALTHLEETAMWANAGIARRE